MSESNQAKRFFLSPGAFFERLELIGLHLSKIAIVDGEIAKLRGEKRRLVGAIGSIEPAVRSDIVSELKARGGQLG